MSTLEQQRITSTRATAFAMLAEANKMESDLILSKKPSGAGRKPGTSDMLVLAEEARFLFEDRRRRERYLPSAFLGEPAWDMLLMLFATSAKGYSMTTTAACEASQAPMTTALRVIKQLKEAELAENVEAPGDKRRSDLRLTTLGLETMHNLLSGLGIVSEVSSAAGENAPEAPASDARKAWKSPGLEEFVITTKLDLAARKD